ncbi:HAD family hydrolase [uncultured Cohaesibacter sp.]|uniref:HAD family hydrolase n=1 Tax=uncultured Cohaesibacter sp. TaxID=1002546 RepID=UPI00374962CC
MTCCPRGSPRGLRYSSSIAHLGLDASRVLAAGDTLNDLTMLECGVPAVAVGGAERPLLERVSSSRSCLCCREAIGAAGIAEAIRSLAMHPDI